jgi:hypothetical protein
MREPLGGNWRAVREGADDYLDIPSLMNGRLMTRQAIRQEMNGTVNTQGARP